MSIRYLRLALILALAAPALGAQQAAAMSHDQHGGKPALDAELAGHFKGIALTDAQIRQVTEIKAKHHAAMDALRHGASDQNAPALKAELQKHMDAEHAEFMALLTEPQSEPRPRLASSKPTATNTPPAIAWRQRTWVLGT